MEIFENYWSDTLAGSGNQSWFVPESPRMPVTGRVYYRLFAGGKHNYRLLFSNIVDSTFSDGSHSHANYICDAWELCGAKCAVCGDVEESVLNFMPLSFGGAESLVVQPGMFFASDPLPLEVQSGDYICLEITFRGTQIPYMEEAIIPIFVKRGGSWVPDKRVPIACMVGSDRHVDKRVAFLGDSITEGIGTPENAYTHWNARIAEQMGPKYAYWNLGIGYGRAADAASCGAWFFKAKQADLVNVCFGVNDIFQGFSAKEIKQNLYKIVTELKKSGCIVGIFTVPPFNYEGEQLAIWREVNCYIEETLASIADYCFDVRPDWGQDAPLEHMARYGGHPNEAGCKVLAERYVRIIESKLRELFDAKNYD